jgi:predicted Zn-dependent protease
MPRIMRVVALLFLVVYVSGCATVPVTNRRQLKLIPAPQMASLSFQQYDDVLSKAKLSDDAVQTQRIRKVGGEVAAAAESFLFENNVQMEFDWAFNLIEDDKQINAWAMPGGKVAFYTGILPLCQDDTGIAVVMGHEVAHVLASHGNERMSTALLNQLGQAALSEALKNKPGQTKQIFSTAAGIATQVGYILPFSRMQESEADRIGLIIMAKAGYDPRAAIGFWRRMAAAGKEKPPELLSTHPADNTRIANIEHHLPEALSHHRQRSRR